MAFIYNSFKILLALALVGSLSSVQCFPNEHEIKDNSNSNSSLNASSNGTANNAAASELASRTARIMQIFNKDPKFGAKRFGQAQNNIRSRSDRFPTAVAGQQQRFPAAYQRHQVSGVARPQILRRVQTNLPSAALGLRGAQNQIPRYEIVKSSRYSPAKNGQQFLNGKGSAYWPQFVNGATGTSGSGAQQHPNAVAQAVGQAQYGPNFKASPNFSGNVVVRPIVEQQQNYGQQQQKYQEQREQYNFAKQQQRLEQQLEQQHQQQQQQLNQREQFPSPSQLQQKQQFAYYQQPKTQQQPILQPKPHAITQHVKFEKAPERASLPIFNKPTPSHGYSVYEDTDQLGDYYAPKANEAVGTQEAQEYLKFMSSNGYFLPKLDPNYKQIDDAHDQQQYQQQKLQQNQQQRQYSKSYDSNIAASTYQSQQQQPIKVSQLFHQQDPSPPASATVVRSSYQAGQKNNAFVVNSGGQKVSKHIAAAPILPASQTTSSTTPASASYNHFHFSSSRNRTPEPVRFEFTERDAISPATYTRSPSTGQLRNSGNSGMDTRSNYGRGTPRIPTTSGSTQATLSQGYNAIRHGNERVDDPEDGDDMQETGSDIYGRVPVHGSATATSQTPTTDQKDTEDYCERICSNVQDDDEEIVCGSDGYMYTSEAQMECYASCLHIDVTIQSKGSCTSPS